MSFMMMVDQKYRVEDDTDGEDVPFGGVGVHLEDFWWDVAGSACLADEFLVVDLLSEPEVDKLDLEGVLLCKHDILEFQVAVHYLVSFCS